MTARYGRSSEFLRSVLLLFPARDYDHIAMISRAKLFTVESAIDNKLTRSYRPVVRRLCAKKLAYAISLDKHKIWCLTPLAIGIFSAVTHRDIQPYKDWRINTAAKLGDQVKGGQSCWTWIVLCSTSISLCSAQLSLFRLLIKTVVDFHLKGLSFHGQR